MGLSTSKSTKKIDNKTTENVTQVPVNPPWVSQPIEDLTTRIGDYGAGDPQARVAPASPLQQQAFAMAAGLGGGQRQPQAANPLYGAMTTQGGAPAVTPAGVTASTNNGGVEPGRSTSLPSPGNIGFGPAGGGYGQAFDAASSLALGAATAPANLAGATGYSSRPVGVAGWAAPDVQGAQIGTAASAAIPRIGEATRASMPRIGEATQASIPRIGEASRADLPAIGDVASWQASLINPASIGLGGPGQAGHVDFGAAGQAGGVAFGPAGQAANVTLDPAAQASAMSTLANFQSFLNPYTTGVVDTTLAGFDRNADTLRARQQAAAAASGAFRGSRDAITRSMTEQGLAQERAATEAGLRFGAFDKAMGFSENEANRFTDVSKANAGFANDRNLAQGRIAADIGIANAGNVTQRNIAQGRADADIGISNARNLTDMGIAQGRANADIGISNANNLTQYNLGAGDLFTRIALANQQGLNSAASDRAQAANDYGARTFERGADAALQHAAARDMFARDQFGRDADAALQYAASRDTFARDQFGRDADAALQLAGDSNSFARDQFAADRDRYRQLAELDARARSENAAATNTTWNQNANRRDAGLAFTAGAYNDNQRFNAGQREAALGRALSGANSIGSLAGAYADAYRGDTALTAQLGETQRGIDQQQRLAELAQLQAMAQLYGTLPYGLFNGRNTSGVTTMNGTEVVKSTPSLFQSLMEAGERAAKAIAMGGG